MIHRRALLRTSMVLGLSACTRHREAAPLAHEPTPRATRGAVDLVDWSFPDVDGGARRCVVLLPHGAVDASPLPLLIALHGMGETRDPRSGAYGWLDDYAIDKTIAALIAPPLTAAAFGGLVTPDALTAINVDLAAHPYRGMAIACPYLPATIGREIPVDSYASWLVDVLVVRLRNELRATADCARVGIDGVSFGGRVALDIGLRRRDTFGVVGALQPAIGDDDASLDRLADDIRDHLAGRPLQLVTSRDDRFRAAVTSLSQRLAARAVAHTFTLTEGPHDYVWNRGPGAIAMLRFHERAQNRSPSGG